MCRSTEINRIFTDVTHSGYYTENLENRHLGNFYTRYVLFKYTHAIISLSIENTRRCYEQRLYGIGADIIRCN